MVVVIHLLALGMIAAGIASLLVGTSLVPTDLGFSYAQIGAIFLASGVVTLAIGLATRALSRALERITAPQPLRVEAESPARAPGLAGAEAVIAAAGGGALVAGAALAADQTRGSVAESAGEPVAGATPMPPVSAMPDPMMPDPMMPEPAFAEPRIPEPSLPAFPTPEFPPPEARIPDARSPEFRPAPPAPQRDLFGDLAPPPAPDLDAGRIGIALEIPVPPRAAETPADTPSAVELPATEPVAALDAANPADSAADASPEAPEAGASPETPPVPGLIADADLAAIAEAEEPPLAPIETLDIVGSYDSAGTRFTMYSDGSVTAVGPDGERRFRSLEALRRHLDQQLG
ncbi:MAG: hypothetical protein ACK4YX_06250 [Rhabdaerophilum calidifontis]